MYLAPRSRVILTSSVDWPGTACSQGAVCWNDLTQDSTSGYLNLAHNRYVALHKAIGRSTRLFFGSIVTREVSHCSGRRPSHSIARKRRSRDSRAS
eukprot:s6250_g5.t1